MRALNVVAFMLINAAVMVVLPGYTRVCGAAYEGAWCHE